MSLASKPARPLRFTWNRVAAASWYVRADDSSACGGVWRELGQWRGEVWPRGRLVVGAYFASAGRARQQIERWLCYHPHVADVVADPRGSRGRSLHRPDPMLSRYLREYAIGTDDRQ